MNESSTCWIFCVKLIYILAIYLFKFNSKKYKKFYKSRVIYHILCLKHFGLLSGSFTVNLLFHWAKIDFQNVTFIFTSFVQFFIILICDLLWYFYSRTINFLFFPFCSSVLEPYFNLLLRHTKFSKNKI